MDYTTLVAVVVVVGCVMMTHVIVCSKLIRNSNCIHKQFLKNAIKLHLESKSQSCTKTAYENMALAKTYLDVIQEYYCMTNDDIHDTLGVPKEEFQRCVDEIEHDFNEMRSNLQTNLSSI